MLPKYTNEDEDKYNGFLHAERLAEDIATLKAQKGTSKACKCLLDNLQTLLDLSYHVASDSYPDEAISNLESFLS